MRIGLDTSVLLRLLLDDPPDQAQRAKTYLNELRDLQHQAMVSDLVLAEAYFALQMHYSVSKLDILRIFKSVFSDGEILCSEVASKVLNTPLLHQAKPGFVDRLIHGSYLEEINGMVTFEKAAKKLSGVLVL